MHKETFDFIVGIIDVFASRATLWSRKCAIYEEEDAMALKHLKEAMTTAETKKIPDLISLAMTYLQKPTPKNPPMVKDNAKQDIA